MASTRAFVVDLVSLVMVIMGSSSSGMLN